MQHKLITMTRTAAARLPALSSPCRRCKKEEAPKAEAAAPLAVPTNGDRERLAGLPDRRGQAQHGRRHQRPFVYFLPAGDRRRLPGRVRPPAGKVTERHRARHPGRQHARLRLAGLGEDGRPGRRRLRRVASRLDEGRQGAVHRRRPPTASASRRPSRRRAPTTCSSKPSDDGPRRAAAWPQRPADDRPIPRSRIPLRGNRAAAMSLKINELCVNCDVCEPACPNQAISQGETHLRDRSGALHRMRRPLRRTAMRGRLPGRMHRPGCRPSRIQRATAGQARAPAAGADLTEPAA